MVILLSRHWHLREDCRRERAGVASGALADLTQTFASEEAMFGPDKSCRLIWSRAPFGYAPHSGHGRNHHEHPIPSWLGDQWCDSVDLRLIRD